MSNSSEKATSASQLGSHGEAKAIWNDSGMPSGSANVVNAAATREEVSLFFGTNRTWNPSSGNGVEVELTNRMILSPFAAKRLLLVLSGVIKDYEAHNGKLVVVPGQPAAAQSEQPKDRPADAN